MTMSKSQCEQSYRLLVVGDEGVGKTIFSLVNSILYSRESIINVCGFDARKKEINLNGERIKLKIYDGSSAQGHRSIIRSFYKIVQGIFIIYDTTNKESFENLKIWLHDIHNYGNKHKHVMKLIIGNKCDLARQKAVSFDEAIEYGMYSKISMFEVSARDLTNVELAFEHMVLKIQSNLTITINDEPDHDREETVLKFVPYIFDIGSNVAEENVNEQGLHDNIENEDVQVSTEELDDVEHTESVDERKVERAQIPSSDNQTIEEKAKQLDVISFSKNIITL
ncbi:unnamed protein product [Adineta steineri]|uniref:Uncharacterized protein n=1 Tax=Adineta steineri TaxID=433720 RepID=A0A819NKQ8_9BILA|nr:unnamed protein product [Adineta steineri]CAF0943993.1 unnamed protein product [Adineta steineri]CAF3998834.1 unnamed protein product [Adineta steineri]CAF4145382.1 unnamed protein product [Adineta steineri]